MRRLWGRGWIAWLLLAAALAGAAWGAVAYQELIARPGLAAVVCG